jgi:hypothetical protein
MTALRYQRTLAVLRVLERAGHRLKVAVMGLPRAVVWTAAVAAVAFAVIANLALLGTLRETSTKQVSTSAGPPTHRPAKTQPGPLPAVAAPEVPATSTTLAPTTTSTTVMSGSVPSGSGGYSSAFRGQPGTGTSPPAALPEIHWPIVLPVPVLGAITLIVVRRRRSQRPPAI